MMTPLNLSHLRAIAEAATQGEWRHFHDTLNQTHWIRVPDRVVTFDDDHPSKDEPWATWTINYPGEGAPRDAIHIATFDPPTILKLIDRLVAAEHEIGDLKGFVEMSAALEKHQSAEAAESLAEQARREEPYLVWSNEHRAWWRPNSAGYTTHVSAAGRYSRDEAIGIAKGARDGWSWRDSHIPDEIAVREADVLACEFSRATQGGKTDV